jgi:hypothetical protein
MNSVEAETLDKIPDMLRNDNRLISRDGPE